MAQERTYYNTGELKMEYKKSNGKLNGISKVYDKDWTTTEWRYENSKLE